MEEVPDDLCDPLSVDLSNTTWPQRELINKLSGNACVSHGIKAIIKNRYPHIVTFGTITRIRPKYKYHDNYRITFGTTNVMVPYGIIFSAGFGFGAVLLLVPYRSIVFHKYLCINSIRH